MTSDEQHALIQQWSGLPVRVLKNFAGINRDNRDDCLQEARLAMVTAAREYDPARSRFTTFAWRPILYRMITFLRKEGKHAGTITLGGAVESIVDPASLEEDDGPDPQPLYRALKTLPERSRQILFWRYWQDETLQEIGDRLGITRERVRQIEGKALARLRRYLEPAAA